MGVDKRNCRFAPGLPPGRTHLPFLVRGDVCARLIICSKQLFSRFAVMTLR